MELPRPLLFDWDDGNINKNWEKHKIHYKDIEEVFFNRPLLFFPDEKHSQQELRITAYGITNNIRQLTVVFTQRGSKIRVISARNQNRKERNIYEKK